MIHAVLFDCEGVLIDSEALWDQVQQALFRHCGRIYRREAWKMRLVGLSNADAALLLAKSLDLSARRVAQFRSTAIAALLEKKARWMPGAKAALQALPAGIRRCVVTSMKPAHFRIANQRLAIRAALGGPVFFTRPAGLQKADASLFLHAASQLRCAPEHCLLIEDSALALAAARAAGFRTIGLSTTLPRSALSDADERFADWSRALQGSKLFPTAPKAGRR